VVPGLGGAKEFQQDGAISSQIKGTRLVNDGLGTLKRLKMLLSSRKVSRKTHVTGRCHIASTWRSKVKPKHIIFTSEPVDHHELKVQLTLTTERDMLTDIPSERKSRSANEYANKSIHNK
jgi:hypothetical protein